MSALKTPTPPCLDNLVDLASRTGIDVRPTLLRVLTDLYVQKAVHSPAEAAQYVELAGRLIEVVDPATRGLVAGRLAAYPAAPAMLLQRLVDFGALPHLPELSRAAAARPAPAAVATTVPALAAPQAATATAKPAVNELAVMFFKAAPDERRSILVNIASGTPATRFAARPDAADIARRLEAAALQRNTREFAAVIERALFIAPAIAEMMTSDPAGEPLVVIAKAIGMSAETLQRILMFLNPKIGQSAETVYRLNTLFHEVSASACAHMLEQLRDAGQRRSTTFQSLHYDDEKPNARASATPGQHQQPVRRGAPLTDRYRGTGR